MKRTRWLAAVGLIGLMASSGGPFAAEPGTGSWLLETCRGDQGDAGRAFCMGYTMGLADLMVGQGRICMPANLSSEQLRQAVESHLQAHPDKLNQHPVLLVIEALDSSFPCR
jgi:hypothetical protein